MEDVARQRLCNFQIRPPSLWKVSMAVRGAGVKEVRDRSCSPSLMLMVKPKHLTVHLLISINVDKESVDFP